MMLRKRTKIIEVIALSILVASCATPPIVPLHNSNNISLDGFVLSEIRKTTGMVDGSVYSGAYTKIFKFHYDEEKQRQFVDLVEKEIVAAGASKNVVGGCHVLVHFDNTYYESNSTQYYFTVSLDISCNERKYSTVYNLDSSKLETPKEKWMHGPLNRRNRIEQRLLELILTDIHKFVNNA